MLEGQKVRLRAVRREDLDLAVAYLNELETRALLDPAIPWPTRREDEDKWFDKLDSDSESTYHFSIEDRVSGAYLGGCGLTSLDQKNRVATLSIFLGQEHTGKGYGTDALRVLVDFCFAEVNLNRLQLNVFAFNARALKSYQNAGFVLEGTLREAMFRRGAYHDEYVLGCLRRDWQARGAGPAEAANGSQPR